MGRIKIERFFSHGRHYASLDRLWQGFALSFMPRVKMELCFYIQSLTKFKDRGILVLYCSLGHEKMTFPLIIGV
jgi:hypothetical protein